MIDTISNRTFKIITFISFLLYLCTSLHSKFSTSLFFNNYLSITIAINSRGSRANRDKIDSPIMKVLTLVQKTDRREASRVKVTPYTRRTHTLSRCYQLVGLSVKPAYRSVFENWQAEPCANFTFADLLRRA